MSKITQQVRGTVGLYSEVRLTPKLLVFTSSEAKLFPFLFQAAHFSLPTLSSRGTDCTLANAHPKALEVMVSKARAEDLPTVYFLHTPHSQVL